MACIKARMERAGLRGYVLLCNVQGVLTANTKGQSGKSVGQLNRLEGDTEGAEGVGLQSDHGAVELLELQPT